eukprot:c46514_g1_i1 orf=81-236(+)
MLVLWILNIAKVSNVGILFLSQSYNEGKSFYARRCNAVSFSSISRITRGSL